MGGALDLGWSSMWLFHKAWTRKTKRIQLALFGMQKRTFGPYLATMHRILISRNGRRETMHTYQHSQHLTSCMSQQAHASHNLTEFQCRGTRTHVHSVNSPSPCGGGAGPSVGMAASSAPCVKSKCGPGSKRSGSSTAANPPGFSAASTFAPQSAPSRSARPTDTTGLGSNLGLQCATRSVFCCRRPAIYLVEM
jgi:hypothetical protein